MKKINMKVLPFIMGLVTVVCSITACKSAKDKEMMADSVQAKITADSLQTIITTDSARKAMIVTGTAKPNPNKKNGKGLVIFQTDWEKNYEKEYAGMTIEMDKQGIYSRAEIRPSYPGGQDALAKFIQENIVYPEPALENGVEGNVEVIFAVDENGKVYTPSIKGEKEGYGLDEAAVNVVGKMPKWNPGQIKGKNVKSYYTLPISFKIN